MNSIKVCEYSRSRSFHDDLILQDQASGERSQDHWSSGFTLKFTLFDKNLNFKKDIFYGEICLKSKNKCKTVDHGQTAPISRSACQMQNLSEFLGSSQYLKYNTGTNKI